MINLDKIDNLLLLVVSKLEKTNKPLLLEIIKEVFESGGLIWKSTKEIYHKTETSKTGLPQIQGKNTFNKLLTEVIILDLVFSVDSIITAVGMVQELWVMYTAVIVTVIIMLFASKPISGFITRHPSFKILALCFLMIIGVSLLAEGFHFEIPKGYIYFSMAFAFLVDVIQMKTVRPQE